jgi:N-methylhydantoinase B/oxoprolinase/acetone carboxylase alpha subunit
LLADIGLALVSASVTGGHVVTKQPREEVVELFRRHLRFLRESREDALARIAASRETIERSRELIVQIDEQTAGWNVS